MPDALPVVTEEQLVEIARETWTAFLGDDGTGLVPGTRPSGPMSFTGCVNISGAWNGSVLVTCSEALARDAAATLFDTGVDALEDDEVSDAVGEITNVIGGTVKAMLPEPSRLSIPAVATGAYAVRLPGAVQQSKVGLVWQDEPLVISVWEG